MDDKAALTMLAKALDTPNEWQDISTAPKDGRYILAFNAESYWPDNVEETYWIVQWDGRWRIELDGQTAEPTHWMPLPPPPNPTDVYGER